MAKPTVPVKPVALPAVGRPPGGMAMPARPMFRPDALLAMMTGAKKFEPNFTKAGLYLVEVLNLKMGVLPSNSKPFAGIEYRVVTADPNTNNQGPGHKVGEESINMIIDQGPINGKDYFAQDLQHFITNFLTTEEYDKCGFVAGIARFTATLDDERGPDLSVYQKAIAELFSDGGEAFQFRGRHMWLAAYDKATKATSNKPAGNFTNCFWSAPDPAEEPAPTT